MVKSGVPMQRIATDILGELPETGNGNKYILVVSDYFTKWTEAFAMANMEAGTVARIIVEEVVTRFGVPHVIHSDQGRQYESRLFQEMCQMLGTTKTRTTPYHPPTYLQEQVLSQGACHKQDLKELMSLGPTLACLG
jgi:transposase InsO family protein